SRYPFPLPSPHDPRPLPSFPTRRSSDLAPHVRRSPLAGVPAKSVIIQFAKGDQIVPNPTQTALVRAGELADRTTFFRTDLFYARSEEHTSELQSLTNLVCRLLLEKKNNT